MKISARFYVNQIVKNATDYLGVTLLPVTRTNEGNTDWSKYTPSGKFEMSVSSQTGAAAWFESMLGKDVAITFEKADLPEE